jgi:hypothetical protein
MERAFISLSAAAAIAYTALREFMHPGEHRPGAAEYEEALALIAGHIAVVAPVLGSEHEQGALHEIPRAVLAEGNFRGGALRLQFNDGRAPYVRLAMRRVDLDPILERLRASYSPIGKPARPHAQRATVTPLRKTN